MMTPEEPRPFTAPGPGPRARWGLLPSRGAVRQLYLRSQFPAAILARNKVRNAVDFYSF